MDGLHIETNPLEECMERTVHVVHLQAYTHKGYIDGQL